MPAIEEVYEPFLIKEGFIQRTSRGRIATPLAYRHLGLERYMGVNNCSEIIETDIFDSIE